MLTRHKIGYPKLEDEIVRLQGICDRFEAQYGVSTEEWKEAFRGADGILDETDDFQRWTFARTQLRLLMNASRSADE